jgi:transcriptional regulator with XRE-family HTH domain
VLLVDDLRFGITVRTVRIRRSLRQDDLAGLTHVSRTQIARIEHGHLDSVSVGTLRTVCGELEIRVDLLPRWRGGDLDRMLSARHAALAESVVRTLRRDSPDWQVIPEVSFSIWGERGVIDLLAWHPGRRALLIIELKTELVDIGEMLGTMDRKRRLARSIATERGWDPVTISGWIILASGRTNERRVAASRATLRAAYPDDGRQMRGWLRDPTDPVAALSVWPAEPRTASGTSGTTLAPRRRVRVRGSRGRDGAPAAGPADASGALPRSVAASRLAGDDLRGGGPDEGRSPPKRDVTDR